MKRRSNYDIKVDEFQLLGLKAAFPGSILLFESALIDILVLKGVNIPPNALIIFGFIPVILLTLTMATKCLDRVINCKGVEAAEIFCAVMACLLFFYEKYIDANKGKDKLFSIIAISVVIIMTLWGTATLLLHKYEMSEKSILKKLKIEDFSSLTRDNIIVIAFMLQRIKQEVTAKVLTSFPDFEATIRNLMVDYKNSLNNSPKIDEVTSSLIDSVILQTKESSPSLDKRFYMIEKMREISDSLEEKQLEHRKFIYALWAIGMHSLYGITVSLEPMISDEEIHTIVIDRRKYFYDENRKKLKEIVPTILQNNTKCIIKIKQVNASPRAYDSLISQLDNAKIFYFS